MSLWKILYANFHRACKTRIKVFLEIPRIQQSQVDDTFDVVIQISSASDGILINSALLENQRRDEELSKSLATIKTKEQCEQSKVLLALDFRFLNGSDYTWEKPDGTSLPHEPIRFMRDGRRISSGRCAPTTWT